MFWTSVRVSPCSALWRFSSLGRATVNWSLSQRDLHVRVQPAAQLTAGSLDRHIVALELKGHTFRHRNRLSTDTRHRTSYQTTASSSPPRFAVRASRSVISPRGVETMAMPRPFLTLGSSRHFT